MNSLPQDQLPTLELWSSETARVCLSFRRRGDRYEHCLEVIGDGSRRSEILLSCEGTDQDFWPPSPALQQLTFHHDEPGNPCVLLLGMAGKTHWSLSVELQEASLVFDAACRVYEQPAWLGSSYWIAAPSRWSTDGTLSLPLEHGDLDLILEPMSRDCALIRDSENAGLAIEPLAEIKKWPETARWRYRMRVSDPAGTSNSGSST